MLKDQIPKKTRTSWPGPSAENCRIFFAVRILEDFARDFPGGFSGRFFPQKREKTGDKSAAEK